MALCGKRAGVAIFVAVVSAALTNWSPAQTTSPQESLATHKTELHKSQAEWFLRGRAAPGNFPATLLQQAYRDKLNMRKARMALQPRTQLGTLSVVPRDISSLGWSPLGPAPLCSDATGADQN